MSIFRNMDQPSENIKEHPGYSRLSDTDRQSVDSTYNNVFLNNQARMGIKVAQGMAYEAAKQMCESLQECKCGGACKCENEGGAGEIKHKNLIDKGLKQKPEDAAHANDEWIDKDETKEITEGKTAVTQDNKGLWSVGDSKKKWHTKWSALDGHGFKHTHSDDTHHFFKHPKYGIEKVERPTTGPEWAEDDVAEGEKAPCFCGHAQHKHGPNGCKECRREGIMKPEHMAHEFKPKVAMKEEESEHDCPHCGSADHLSFHDYDFGREKQTGYSDAGTRYKCNNCGNSGSEEDTRTKAWKPSVHKKSADIMADLHKSLSKLKKPVNEQVLLEKKKYTHKIYTGPVLSHNKEFVKKLHSHYPNSFAGTEHVYVRTNHPAEHVANTMTNKMGMSGFSKPHQFQTKVHEDVDELVLGAVAALNSVR